MLLDKKYDIYIWYDCNRLRYLGTVDLRHQSFQLKTTTGNWSLVGTVTIWQSLCTFGLLDLSYPLLFL